MGTRHSSFNPRQVSNVADPKPSRYILLRGQNLEKCRATVRVLPTTVSSPRRCVQVFHSFLTPRCIIYILAADLLGNSEANGGSGFAKRLQRLTWPWAGILKRGASIAMVISSKKTSVRSTLIWHIEKETQWGVVWTSRTILPFSLSKASCSVRCLPTGLVLFSSNSLPKLHCCSPQYTKRILLTILQKRSPYQVLRGSSIRQ